MKAISLWQPWAHCLVTAAKIIETRSYATKHRGPLAIHAGKRPLDGPATELCNLLEDEALMYRTDLVFGAVIGVVNITDCKPVEDVRGSLLIFDDNGKPCDWEIEYDLGDYSDKRYAWLTDGEPLKLSEPIPMKGRQSFFEVPDSLIKQFVRV